MTEQEWLECADSHPMIRFLTASKGDAPQAAALRSSLASDAYSCIS